MGSIQRNLLGCSTAKPILEYSAGANEIVSRWLINRLAYLLFRVRRICQRTTSGLLLTESTIHALALCELKDLAIVRRNIAYGDRMV